MRRGVVGIKKLDTLNFWVYTKLWLKNRYFFRSAGACPPRSLHGEGQALALRANRRYRLTVARGPVPRDRWIARGVARETRSDARVASEGPRATVKEGFLPPRSR